MTKQQQKNFEGECFKRLVAASPLTREMLVVKVQQAGFRFSTSRLEKMTRGELPIRNTDLILKELAKALKCDVSDFMQKNDAA